MNQEVKTRIIVVATDCFRKYGIKNTSMECVASSVGISKRTLYQCFSSKRVLLAECVRICVEENREQIRRRIAGKGCMEAMVGMCHVVYGLLTSLYPAFRKDVVRYGEVLSLLRESYRTPFFLFLGVSFYGCFAYRCFLCRDGFYPELDRDECADGRFCPGVFGVCCLECSVCDFV